MRAPYSFRLYTLKRNAKLKNVDLLGLLGLDHELEAGIHGFDSC